MEGGYRTHAHQVRSNGTWCSNLISCTNLLCSVQQEKYSCPAPPLAQPVLYCRYGAKSSCMQQGCAPATMLSTCDNAQMWQNLAKMGLKVWQNLAKMGIKVWRKVGTPRHSSLVSKHSSPRLLGGRINRQHRHFLSLLCSTQPPPILFTRFSDPPASQGLRSGSLQLTFM